MTATADAVVLGAGPAGLAVAYGLGRAGRSVDVVERAPVVGGLASSFEVGGVRVDHGSHRLHPSCDPELLGLFETLLGDDLQLRRRNGRIRLGGRWVGFPPGPNEIVRRLPPRFALGVAFDALTGPLRRPRADTFAEVVRARLGPTMAREFYDPYVRKIWATAPDELSGELARRRVGARSGRDLLRKIVVRDTGARGTFWYPRHGFGQLCERLAEQAAGVGVRFHLGTTVAAVRADDAGAEVSTTGGPEAGVFRGGMACSTLPLPVLATLLADAPAPVRVAAASLRFRALALVYLVLPQPRYTPFDAHYFPALDAPFSRVSEPKNYRDGAGSDPPDRTVLCAEVPCSVGDEVWTASDDDLGALVAEALARQGLPPARAVGVEVRRLPTAYPVYRSGFEEPLTTLAEWVERHPTVLTFGRQGLFAHDNTHHALAMGMAAAASLRTGHLDRDGWNRSLESFRDNVVED